MNRIRTTIGPACVIALAGLLAGCNSAPPSHSDDAAPNILALEEVSHILRMYKKSGQGAPKSIKDVAGMSNGLPAGIEALRKGNVLLYWEAPFDPDDSKTVIAYQKEAPEKGGEVLMRDGTVAHMTAEEFQAAPKPADGKLTIPPAEKTKKRG